MKIMNTRLATMLVGLLGFFPIGCEKVPTFQELTGQEGNKNSPAVVKSEAPAVTPEKSDLEGMPTQQAPVTEIPAEVFAALARQPGSQLSDREIVRATKVPSLLGEFKSLDVSRSALTDEGIRLLGHFTEVTQMDLSALQMNGTGIEGLKPLGHLRELVMVSVKIGLSSGWEDLGKLSQVEKLDLSWSNIADANVPQLIGMTGLKELNVSNTSLSDSALEQLAKLENLEILRIENTQRIKGDGLKAFIQKNQAPRLRCLYASGTSLTREGLSNVKKIGSLEVFDNSNTGLSDQLLFELKGATNLKSLIVGKNSLTAAAGLTIKTMRNLETLDLQQSPTVTSQILGSLSSLTDLTNLNVSKTGCTLSAVQGFRKTRKKCTVVFDENASQ